MLHWQLPLISIFYTYFILFLQLVSQGFTYPVRSHFLENILEITGHRLTPYNQIDDYGQEKMWKMQKQAAFRKRKSQIASVVEVCKSRTCTLSIHVMPFTYREPHRLLAL